MSFEKRARNSRMKKLHRKFGGPLSYREIAKVYDFKSVKTVHTIVNRDSKKTKHKRS